MNYSEINLNRQLINYQNIIKPKRRIRNKQPKLNVLHVNTHHENSVFVITNNNNSLNNIKNLSVYKLPKINLKQLVGKVTKENKEYEHYFKFNETQKEHQTKKKLQTQEQLFDKLRKQYSFYQGISRNNHGSDRKITMKKRETSFTNMFKKTDKTIDYFHSGRLKEHIFKYRFKKKDIDNCISM